MTATTPATIQALIVGALLNRTDCGERVYAPATWPTRPDMMPVILVRYAASDRSAAGRGEIQFTAVDTFQIILRVAELAAGDDNAVVSAEATAWRIWRQIEVAVISDPDLRRATSQFPFIRNAIARDSEGQQTLVGMNAELGVEYYQGPEDFLAYDGEDIPGEPLPDLTEVRIDSRQGGIDADDLEAGPIASAVTLAP